MKDINKILPHLWGIHSEPGDGTMYDYMVMQNYDEFFFMPTKDSFRYPQHINYWVAKDASDEIILEISKEQMCNPWTIRECIRTILEMRMDRG